MEHILAQKAKERNTDVPSMIIDEINQADGNVSEAARKLGVVHSVLYHHMKKHGIKKTHCFVQEEQIEPA